MGGETIRSWRTSPERTPDPAKASEVEVRFTADGPATSRVELEHRGFGRHGPGGDACRAGLGSPEGWPYILDRCAAVAS